MNLKSSAFFCLLFLLVSCKSQEVVENYLIEIDEFEALSKLKTTKIIDFRKIEAYNSGHIKKAIHIWRSDIEDPTFMYGGMKASQKQIESLFSKLGIENDDTLLIYDDKGLCDAARLWWVLQYYNFKNVKLLNGGLTTLKNANKPFTKETSSNSPSIFTLKGINADLFASKEQIKNAIKNKSVILDTRTTDEYKGEYIKNGAFRAGRIPSSKLIDWANAIDYNGDKKMKSVSELKEIYTDISPDKNAPVFVYCHSGVRSAHTTFVLTQLLGYTHVLNYDGSWTEWSYHQDLPIINDSRSIK